MGKIEIVVRGNDEVLVHSVAESIYSYFDICSVSKSVIASNSCAPCNYEELNKAEVEIKEEVIPQEVTTKASRRVRYPVLLYKKESDTFWARSTDFGISVPANSEKDAYEKTKERLQLEVKKGKIPEPKNFSLDQYLEGTEDHPIYAVMLVELEVPV